MNIFMLLGIVAFVYIFAVATLVDVYKKCIRGYYIIEDNTTVRKTKAKGWEIVLVAGILSAIFAVLLFFTVDVKTILPSVNIMLVVPYAIIIYLLQKPTCMTVIKRLSNAIARAWLKKHGIVLEGYKYDE